MAVVFGTRPEIIKLAGIIELLGDRARTIFSGQHFDDLMSRTVLRRSPAASTRVSCWPSAGRAEREQIGELVLRLEEQFAERRPALVVVQGDTNTALGGALAANALEIPLVHVEAGLRSFDRRMPEEHNRVVTDHLADLCLAPTDQARKNLLAERIPDERIAVTGNTVVDVASRLMPAAEERADLLTKLGLVAGAFILATFHRPENVDDVDRLENLLGPSRAPRATRLFSGASADAQAHQGPRARRAERTASRWFRRLATGRSWALAAECAFLISDSGGVQEEASVVKRPAIVVRRSTERPEVLGTFATLVPSLADLPIVADQLLGSLADTHRRLAGTRNSLRRRSSLDAVRASHHAGA